MYSFLHAICDMVKILPFIDFYFFLFLSRAHEGKRERGERGVGINGFGDDEFKRTNQVLMLSPIGIVPFFFGGRLSLNHLHKVLADQLNDTQLRLLHVLMTEYLLSSG